MHLFQQGANFGPISCFFIYKKKPAACCRGRLTHSNCQVCLIRPQRSDENSHRDWVGAPPATLWCCRLTHLGWLCRRRCPGLDAFLQGKPDTLTVSSRQDDPWDSPTKNDSTPAPTFPSVSLNQCFWIYLTVKKKFCQSSLLPTGKPK